MIIFSANGRNIEIDEADFPLVSAHKWTVYRYGRGVEYAVYWDGKRNVYLHRFLLGSPAGMIIDHINGDGLDNRRANLRICSNLENRRNQKLRVDSASGYKGVCRNSGKWQAKIRIEGKWHSLGLFVDKEDAARAYDAAAIRTFGDFARLNFPREKNA